VWHVYDRSVRRGSWTKCTKSLLTKVRTRYRIGVGSTHQDCWPANQETSPVWRQDRVLSEREEGGGRSKGGEPNDLRFKPLTRVPTAKRKPSPALRDLEVGEVVRRRRGKKGPTYSGRRRKKPEMEAIYPKLAMCAGEILSG
jgi:hypothetical protein